LCTPPVGFWRDCSLGDNKMAPMAAETVRCGTAS